MPLLVLAGVLVFALLAAVALMPVAVVRRYRVGTSRRAARGWIAAVNVWGLALSSLLLLAGAAVTSRWVPGAFSYALAGLAGGGVLGMLGLALTRWEVTPRDLHYTPNRLLVLAITLVVAARLLYGFWRGWESWRSGLEGGTWLVEAGAAESIGAGAVVLGYYFVYWAGVRRRVRQYGRH